MEKDLRDVKEYYQQNYYHDGIAESIKERVHQQFHSKKKISFGKKLLFTGYAAAAAFAVFVGLAFFSPAVASVAAKVPFLNAIFKAPPLVDELHDKLADKGYKIDGVGTQYRPKKIVSVTLQGTDDYIAKAEPEVKKIVTGILQGRGLDAYEVVVEKARDRVAEPPTPEEQQQEANVEKVFTIIEKILKSYGYKDYSYEYNVQKAEYTLKLPNTVTNTAEVEQKIQSELAAQHLESYVFKVGVYDVKKKKREERWMPVIRSITEGVFGSSKYKVTGVGYTNKNPDYMTIRINTSVSSKDSDYETVMKDIEDTIREFLTSDEIKAIIKDDAYKVIVISKDKKERVIE